MVDIPRDYGQAGSAEHDSVSDSSNLAAVLRDIATDISASLGTSAPGWDTVAVAANTVTLTQPGYVLHVHALAGSSAGPKAVISTGTPSAGQVRVTYDASGVPTLLFAVADAITSTAVHQIRRPSTYTSQLHQAV